MRSGRGERGLRDVAGWAVPVLGALTASYSAELNAATGTGAAGGTTRLRSAPGKAAARGMERTSAMREAATPACGSPSLMPSVKARHACSVNSRCGPSASLESRTSTVPGAVATSAHSLEAQWLDFLQALVTGLA